MKNLNDDIVAFVLGAIVATLLLVIVITTTNWHKQAVAQVKLDSIAVIAERQAYDTGDTTDMWWAVVEIARGE